MWKDWPRIFLTISLISVISSCQKQADEASIAFKVYCEMVANDAKPVAFQYPMAPESVDLRWSDFEQIAKGYDVQLFREDSFPETLLFPSEATAAKTVVIIYTGNRLKQYQQWKHDVLVSNEEDFKSQEALARRLGRLLGYSAQGVNNLLRKNTAYRDLASFGIDGQLTHLYYEDIGKAVTFYSEVLGLPQNDSTRFQISTNGYIQLHLFDEKHTKEQPKSTAIALLTDQLPEWYAYVKEKEVPIKYTYRPKDDGPHDGFVVIDPGGYLLEFEQFKQHPENELFMAALAQTKKVVTKIDSLNFFATVTWTYHQDLLKMQHFYDEVLGYTMVADQGWTKIYQTSPSTFIGLVDERRGMQNYADDKAVNIEWNIADKPGFDQYANTHLREYHTVSGLIGPEKYQYIIR
ncbi:VOC family protein [uncultured Croceitalea sp.]|uniref:VOC family protein n=1 Tax=uncultured Croceitalea sp. TaxID=1798908 RepID=UPI003305BD2E